MRNGSTNVWPPFFDASRHFLNGTTARATNSTAMPSSTRLFARRMYRLDLRLQCETRPGCTDDEVGSSLYAQPLSIDAEVVVVVGAAVALPMQSHPLIPLFVGVVDEARGFFGADTFALRCSRDQGFSPSITEYVKRVLALCQHFLGTTSDYDERSTRDCLFDYPVGDLDHLLVSRAFHGRHRRNPLLRAHRHRGGQPLDQGWYAFLPRLHLGDAQPHSRRDCIHHRVVQQRPAKYLGDDGGNLGASRPIKPRDGEDRQQLILVRASPFFFY